MSPRIGLCSVTFRSLDAIEVVELASSAGLESVEWGSDLHVPAGDLATARRVADATRAAGLAVSSYGSYLGFPWPRGPEERVDDVVASAVALGAPRIRAWAGPVGSASADDASRATTLAAIAKLAAAASEYGIDIALEFHGGTLTDTVDSTLEVLGALSQWRVSTYWQPRVGATDTAVLSDLDRLAGQVSTIHVFSWWPQDQRRRLGHRSSLWRAVARRLVGLPEVTDLLLEFVPDDDPALLAPEAAQLRQWLQGSSAEAAS